GQPERAEFIRVQVALAREAPDHPSRGEWLRREAELLSAHGKEWAGPAAVVDGQYRFRRGFVESVQGPLPSLLRVADGLFAKLPLRGLATNRALASDVRALVSLPRTSRLAALSFSGAMRGTSFRAVVESPHLTGLRGLAVHDTPIRQGGLAALVE